jgi:hypothetical protein
MKKPHLGFSRCEMLPRVPETRRPSGEVHDLLEQGIRLIQSALENPQLALVVEDGEVVTWESFDGSRDLSKSCFRPVQLPQLSETESFVAFGG